VKLDGLWGVIDTLGTVVIGPKYDRIGGIQDGSTVALLPGATDACLVVLRGRTLCMPFNEYWTVWVAELRRSTMPDKELIIRVLEMHATPASRFTEMLNLEDTYVAMGKVRSATTRTLLDAR
jgi:hypothetical protein